MSILGQLSQLPGSYQGPDFAATDRSGAAPYGLLGLGEASLAARLCEDFAQTTLVRMGTQLVLSSPETQAAADDFAALAEVSGVNVVRVGVGQGGRFNLDTLSYLAPGGVLSTYHLAQYVAHATGHGQEALQAEALLSALRDQCAPEVQEGNPARELAWSLWGRAPLLLAPAGEGALIQAWQTLLARVGKVLSVPVEQQPLYTLTGAFEAHHERGDGRLALILGEEDANGDVPRDSGNPHRRGGARVVSSGVAGLRRGTGAVVLRGLGGGVSGRARGRDSRRQRGADAAHGESGEWRTGRRAELKVG